jgi:hypothetical protein
MKLVSLDPVCPEDCLSKQIFSLKVISSQITEKKFLPPMLFYGKNLAQLVLNHIASQKFLKKGHVSLTGYYGNLANSHEH